MVLTECTVTFQTSSSFAYALDSSIVPSQSVALETAQACAAYCYERGCTRAGYDHVSKICIFSYATPDQPCGSTDNTERTSAYEGKDQIWARCIRCGKLLINFILLFIAKQY